MFNSKLLTFDKVVFDVQDSIYYPLYSYFNKSIEEGKVPVEWKKAIVSPIFKKGKKSSPGNYRPVSLTSVVCKICESIIGDKIMNYMSSNDLFTNSQYGFRPSRSCVTQLLEVLDDWSDVNKYQKQHRTKYASLRHSTNDIT
jgi:hypothetical protein